MVFLHTLTSINKMASDDIHLKSDISTNGYYRNLFRSRQHKSKKLIECLAILFTAGADFKPLRRQSSSRAVNSVCGLSSNPHWDNSLCKLYTTAFQLSGLHSQSINIVIKRPVLEMWQMSQLLCSLNCSLFILDQGLMDLLYRSPWTDASWHMIHRPQPA